MFVLGGKSLRGNCQADLYEFHFGKWYLPPPTYYTADTTTPSTPTPTTHAHTLTDTKTWSLVKTTGRGPGPRWGHSAAIGKAADGDVMYIFGGCDASATYAELYAYHFGNYYYKKKIITANLDMYSPFSHAHLVAHWDATMSFSSLFSCLCHS